MTTGLNFWDSSVWALMIELTILLVGMLTANMLRRLIKPLRQSLIPSAVLGGFLVLIGNLVYRKITGDSLFAKVTMETLTYHGLGLGFVAVALRQSEREKNPKANTDVFNSGVTTVSAYLLQGLLGLAITLGLFYALGSWPDSGLLLPMGYGQGPGQAYNWGPYLRDGDGKRGGPVSFRQQLWPHRGCDGLCCLERWRRDLPASDEEEGHHQPAR